VPPALTLNKLNHQKNTLLKAYCFLVFNKNGEAQNHLAEMCLLKILVKAGFVVYQMKNL
jgi:hypothetical protein